MTPKPFSPLVKLMLDLGPLALFVVVFRINGGGNNPQAMIPATAALMAATFVSLALHYVKERKIAVMPLVTGAAVGVFGTLTILLDNEFFIKIKPTVVNLLFAAVLLGGLAMGRPLLKYVLGSALHLSDEGWRKLSLRWGLYFVFLAALNEVIWRNFSVDFWVNFKFFGMTSLTMLFTLLQIPLIQKHMIEAPEATAD